MGYCGPMELYLYRVSSHLWAMAEVSTCTVYAYALQIFAICTGLRAYDAILKDIYDFCIFKLTIIPRFIFELLSVCNDTSYAS